MITAQVVQNCLDDLKTITKVDLAVVDVEGVMVAKNTDRFDNNMEFITEFAASPAGSQVLQGCQYLKIYDEEDPVYVLLCGDSSEEYMIGKIAVSNIQNLITAYKERFDRNNFFQNLILDNLLLVDIYNRAKKLHIEIQKPRVVLLLEIPAGKENYAMEFLKSMFSAQSGDYVTAVDENTLIVIKQVEAKDSYAEVAEVAETTVAMMNTEAMINVRVAYGTIVEELKDVSKSYKEAKMALDVGKIFYAEKTVTAYSTLGIGRLIYQLPINLCEMFIEEIFGGKVPEELDEETLTTINTFLENNLNVSETSRQLYVHRNTLLYRLEKLEKYTGLDIRIFDDALTLKIALMVVRYMRYLESRCRAAPLRCSSRRKLRCRTDTASCAARRWSAMSSRARELVTRWLRSTSIRCRACSNTSTRAVRSVCSR